MSKPSLEQRVEILERNVEELQKLPARLDALTLEFVQFRGEVRAEFSAMRTQFEQLRVEMKAGEEETRRYMRVLYDDLVERLSVIQEGRRTRKKTP